MTNLTSTLLIMSALCSCLLPGCAAPGDTAGPGAVDRSGSQTEMPACCCQKMQQMSAGTNAPMNPQAMMQQMMSKMGNTPDMQARMQLMMLLCRTPIWTDAPCPISAQADRLGLNNEQKNKLAEIENEARVKARAVLTAQQLEQLGPTPQKPVTMMEICPMMGGSPEAESQEVEPQGAERTEIKKDFNETSPLAGEKAPDFTLPTTKGDTLTLSQLLGIGPVVVEFGNYTCPTSRNNSQGLEQLRTKWGERVSFIVVYAHESNAGEGQFADIKQPTTQAERDALAKRFAAEFRPTTPVLVDAIGNKTWNAYGSPLNATFIVKRDGTVFYKEPWAAPSNVDEQLGRLLK